MRHVWMVLAASTIALPAAAQVKAPFLDGTYTMSTEACQKMQALANGGPKSISTVPWSVSRNGIDFWEGSCRFTAITEQRKGKQWRVLASCSEGPDTSKEVYTYVRNNGGSFDVTLKGDKQAVRYTRCDAIKGN